MKQLHARVSSILLVLALLCSLCVPALAANSVAPSLVTLDKTAATVYLHGGTPLPVRLTSTVQPADFDGTVTWNVPDGSKIVIASTDSTGASVSAAADAVAGESAPVTVTATTGSVSKSAVCTVTVKNDVIKSKTFGPFTVEVGKTTHATPSVVWESGVTDSVAAGYYVDNPAIAEVDSQGNVTAHAKGSTKIHTTVGGETLTANLQVVGIEGISLDRNSLSMSVGDAPVALVATVRPAGLNYTPTFTTSDASVASVSADGKVTALRSGAATIIAKVADSSGTEYTASCTVSVAAVTGDVTDTASAGTDLSLKKIYTEIADRYAKAGGSGNPTIAFNSVGSSSVGTLYTTSAKTVAVDSSYYGSLSLVESMVFAPATSGRYIVTYTVSSSGRAAVLTGTITIEVQNAVKNIQIGLGSATEYLFSDVSSGGSTGVSILTDALGAYGSLRFGSITSGSNAGTLYTGMNNGSSVVRSGTVVNSGDAAQLYYVSSRSSAFQIEYSAYSGANATGVLIATGVLTIGTGSDSLNLTVTLDSVDAYRFDHSTRRSSDSADTLLHNAIDANVGSSAWKYIKFDNAASVNTCNGTLYTDSTRVYAVNANTFVASADIDDLYFVPSQSGTFEIGYSVYGSDLSAASLASGKLRIVASNLTSETAALYFSLTPNGSLVFQDSDFETWFIEQHSSRYHLEYVQFNNISRNFGSLYVGGSRLSTGNGYNFYVAGYYDSRNSNARYLADVSFTAPSYAGYQEISFTCYGRNGSNGGLLASHGTLRIYVTANAVPEITYTFGRAGGALMLQESDFANAYRTATASTATSPAFYIQLMELPDYGTLYSNYNEATGRGTELTSSTVDLYPFYVNGTAGTDAVSRLAYVPASRGTGSYSIRYIAFSADGNELYAGKVTFRYSETVSTITVTDGYTFRAEDVCGNASASSVLYVVFDQPLLGKLYLNYSNGRGTPMPNSTKLYVSATVPSGGYPITALTYIPRSDMDGSMPLGFTVYTSYRSYADEMTLKVEKKSASATFSDITAANVGTWAANAVDFASKWGLVNGTGNGLFSPNDTMRRCDLVLILYRNAGSPTVTGTMPYTDVPADAYYRNSAIWAANTGIMTGVVTGNTYNPSGAITRQDFTRILYNYTAAMGGTLSGSANLSVYTDAGKIASYAKDAMAWAVSRGYINGTSATTLSPADKATRAQIATLLHRYLTL